MPVTDFHLYLKKWVKLSDISSMKRYSIKCTPGHTEYIDILKELDDEYLVRFTRNNNGNIRTSEETITRHLFNICVQTGYLNPMTESSVA
jgi:hypothetical protein